MPRKKAINNSETMPQMRPALTVEGRESQLIALATNLAEKKLRDGTASSQIIAYYLKLGSTNNQLEKEILEEQRDYLRTKSQTLKSARKADETYEKALEAFKTYSGHDSEEDY